jgi:hypothetical protein
MRFASEFKSFDARVGVRELLAAHPFGVQPRPRKTTVRRERPAGPYDRPAP